MYGIYSLIKSKFAVNFDKIECTIPIETKNFVPSSGSYIYRLILLVSIQIIKRVNSLEIKADKTCETGSTKLKHLPNQTK
jgi:hypothetical protein